MHTDCRDRRDNSLFFLFLFFLFNSSIESIQGKIVLSRRKTKITRKLIEMTSCDFYLSWVTQTLPSLTFKHIVKVENNGSDLLLLIIRAITKSDLLLIFFHYTRIWVLLLSLQTLLLIVVLWLISSSRIIDEITVFSVWTLLRCSLFYGCTVSCNPFFKFKKSKIKTSLYE
jgi:hypothetical protein